MTCWIFYVVLPDLTEPYFVRYPKTYQVLLVLDEGLPPPLQLPLARDVPRRAPAYSTPREPKG